MSQENVEIVQQILGEFQQTGEPLWDMVDPNVEVYDHDIPDAGTYRGHAGFLKWLADWDAAWSGSSVEPERWIDAGDKVVVVFQMTAKGRGSGVELKRRDAIVMEIRDGKAVRLNYYNSESQALEAVGRSE